MCSSLSLLYFLCGKREGLRLCSVFWIRAIHSYDDNNNGCDKNLALATKKIGEGRKVCTVSAHKQKDFISTQQCPTKKIQHRKNNSIGIW